MNFFKNTPSILVAVFFAVALVSCSKNDDKKSGPSASTQPLGSGNMTLTGHLEKELTGIADFEYFEGAPHATTPGSYWPAYWKMRIYDRNPQTFELYVHVEAKKLDFPFTPGAYEIRPSDSRKEIFWAMFTDVKTEDLAFSPSYTVEFEDPGTMFIESSSDNTVKGSLEFVGYNIRMANTIDTLGITNVSANFVAKEKTP